MRRATAAVSATFRALLWAPVLLVVVLGPLPAAAQDESGLLPGDRIVHNNPLNFDDRLRQATRGADNDGEARSQRELDDYAAFREAERQEADLTQSAYWRAGQAANRNNDWFRHSHAMEGWHGADLRRLQEQIAEAKGIRSRQAKDEEELAGFKKASKELQRQWDELSPIHRLLKSGEELIALAAEVSGQLSELRRGIRVAERKLEMLHAERRVRWLSTVEFPEFVPSSPFGPVQRTIGPSYSVLAPPPLPAGDPCLGPVLQRNALLCNFDTWSSPGAFLDGALGGTPPPQEPDHAHEPQGLIRLNIPAE